tara:strand:- start:4899 stop:5252 length:354 start_codon:yes stop_codon:yes gene_type:complete
MKLTNENFESTLSDNRLVLIDFWAQWCGPCRMLNPIMESLEKKYEGKVIIGKVSTEDEMELTAKYGVRSLPTILIFKDGEIMERFAGAGPERMYSEKLDYYLSGIDIDKKEEVKEEK